MNYIKINRIDDHLRVQMFIDDEPGNWIMYDKKQAETLLKVVTEEVVELLKAKKKRNPCTSMNPDNMCDECDCWKHTRQMCSQRMNDMIALDIVDMLVQRLEDCRRSAAVKLSPYDEFDLGIDCRIANEIAWLEENIEKALNMVEANYKYKIEAL